MIEILDKELKISVLTLENTPNVYYLTYQKDTKCVIDIESKDGDILISPNPQGECTVEELNTIIDRFSNFIFKVKPEVNGILFKTDPHPLLESIGFKLLSKDSEYLYKINNKRIDKVR